MVADKSKIVVASVTVDGYNFPAEFCHEQKANCPVLIGSGWVATDRSMGLDINSPQQMVF